MRKLFLTIVVLLTVYSCGNRDEKDCQCEKQRYERYTVRSTSAGNELLQAYEWRTEGKATPYGTDCGVNGQIPSRGTFGAFLIDYSTYGVTEYEERITCK